MEPHHFGDRLMAAVRRCHTPLVVGIDPNPDQLPSGLEELATSGNHDEAAGAVERFACELIDIVAGAVPAIKPQCAWFERLGPSGMAALARVIDHARQAGLIVIMDGKRNDIGITAAAYARAWMGAKPHSAWGCDALTVSPYPGDDGLTPFITHAGETGSGLFVLVRTSNPGSERFQEFPKTRTAAANEVAGEANEGAPTESVQTARLYHEVARFVQSHALQTAGETGFGVVGAVVGATRPDHLAELRELMPNTIFLVPGYGAQGGRARDLAPAFDSRGLGAVVNSSRAIIFAGNSERYRGASTWQTAVEMAMRDAIAELPSPKDPEPAP
jgi:orotidine-5'-phosphate decarboxylase